MAKKTKKSKKEKTEKDEGDVERALSDNYNMKDEVASTAYDENYEEDYETNKKKFRQSLWTTVWISAACLCIIFWILVSVVDFYCKGKKGKESDYCEDRDSGPTTLYIICLVIAIVVSLAVIYYQCQIEDTDCKFLLYCFVWVVRPHTT